MSRTLFWEDEVPGRTQLLAAVVTSENIKNVTYYIIELKVTSSYENGVTDTRQWLVKRRYSEFLLLHNALTALGFPCPSLPPKQLWGRHTNVFIVNRQNALNCWIQGIVVIWQSVAPARPRVAYAVGQLLEAFLCAPDSETFAKTLEEVQHEEKTAVDEDFDIEAHLPQLAAATITAPAESPFVSHVAAAERPRSSNAASNGQTANTTFAQVAQNRRRSKRASGTGAIAEDHPSSFSDITSLQQRKTDSPTFDDSHDKISKSAPPQHAPGLLSSSLPSYAPFLVQSQVPSAGAIGIAIDMVPSTSPNAQREYAEYITFNNHGQRVRHSFAPFRATVVFADGPEARNEVARSSGLLDACTPVSVPPTPHAQNQFAQQWNQYTSSVLKFVQERLSIVSRNREYNILDRHHPGDDQPPFNHSDNEDDDPDHVLGNGLVRPLLVLNLRDPAKDIIASEELVEDADAGAGGSAQGAPLPPQHAIAASYVMAGDHLINTILKEAMADIVDWQHISNTKEVNIYRRLRPIRKRSLLKVRGPSVQQPSPSPLIGEDRSRGTSAPAPSALTLDGSSVASSLASAQRDASGAAPEVEQSQHCFLGQGIIDAPAEEIFELVRRPELRHFYDQLLNEELLLENLAVGDVAPDFAASGIGNLLVYYHLFETNRCFLRYVRDFCVMQYAKQVRVGNTTKYVVVGASINHPRCPVRDDVERATLDLFGWVVEPITQHQSKVTYMLHIDFGPSGVPNHLLNTISFRQPLAVHYLRKHIMLRRAEERAAEVTRRETEGRLGAETRLAAEARLAEEARLAAEARSVTQTRSGAEARSAADATSGAA